jgi:hypothetical protein
MCQPEHIHPENLNQVEIVGQCYWGGGRVTVSTVLKTGTAKEKGVIQPTWSLSKGWQLSLIAGNELLATGLMVNCAFSANLRQR